MYNEVFVLQLLFSATTAAEWLVTILQHARPHVFHAKAVVLATGGCGKIYKTTSNGFASTGDGFALALDSLIPLRGYGVCSVSPYRHLRAWAFLSAKLPEQKAEYCSTVLGERFMERLCANFEGFGSTRYYFKGNTY